MYIYDLTFQYYFYHIVFRKNIILNIIYHSIIKDNLKMNLICNNWFYLYIGIPYLFIYRFIQNNFTLPISLKDLC